MAYTELLHSGRPKHYLKLEAYSKIQTNTPKKPQDNTKHVIFIPRLVPLSVKGTHMQYVSKNNELKSS